MMRMDECNKIRKAFFTKKQNRHEISKEFKRSWDTINRVVSMEREDLKKRGNRRGRKARVMTEDVIQAIKDYFKEEEAKRVKKKQRYTARAIYIDLKNKGLYTGSLRRMQEKVQELREEHNQTKETAYLPLEFDLGSALQIDHGEVDLEIEGTRVKSYLYVASIPGYTLRYCQVFPTKASESWGEFHERAFRFFGGIFGTVTYDNDSVLVKEVIGKERKQTDFSLELEEYYGFTSHFCNPASGNEKGAVENGVGYCRRNYLAGLPSFESWGSLNIFLEKECDKTIQEESHYKTKEKLATIFTELQKHLKPLLPMRKWRRWRDCRVDKCQLVTVDNRQYSVPEKFVGVMVRVAVSPFEIEVVKETEQIARHTRQYTQADSLHLDHYLEQLYHKPYSLRHSKAMRRHQMHPKLKEMWSRLAQKYETKEANRQFISILQLRRSCAQKEHINAVTLALESRAIEYAAVRHIIKEAQNPTKEKILFSTYWKYDLSPYNELCMEATS